MRYSLLFAVSIGLLGIGCKKNDSAIREESPLGPFAHDPTPLEPIPEAPVVIPDLVPVPPSAGVPEASGQFARWDSDGNNKVDRDEFRAQFSAYYEAWNHDGHGISSPELANGVFKEWDDDENAAISEEEFEDKADDWLGRDLIFDEWDRNDDGRISREEYLTSFEYAGFFEVYDDDDDGQLTDLEVSGFLFTYWDRDENGLIDDVEWRW